MTLELNHELIKSEPLPAATVILLRDTNVGFEVLMLRRHTSSGVLGGAFVFPGGKVDLDLDKLSTHQIRPSLNELRQRLNETCLTLDMTGCLYAAAIRETLEECGLLLGWRGALPPQPELTSRVLREERSLRKVLDRMHGQLDADTLYPWSRWITPQRPSVTNRRFDTRFFVATAPLGQTALHDGHEATECVWMSPRAAIYKYWNREIDLAAPQIITLQHLARFEKSTQIMKHAAITKPRTIRPESIDIEGNRIIYYPGDPLHPDPIPAWIGPTRLTFRNGRFEPTGGLFELF